MRVSGGIVMQPQTRTKKTNYQQTLSPKTALLCTPVEQQGYLDLLLRRSPLCLCRLLLRFPLEPLPHHVPLTPAYGNGTPQRNPEKRDRPADAIRTRRGDLVDDGNDGEGDSENQGWDRPEEGLDVKHAAKARAGFVPCREGLTVRPSSAGINGNNVFNKVVYSGQDLYMLDIASSGV